MWIQTYKSQLIEVIHPGIAGGNQSTLVQFPDQPYLRYKPVFGIETYDIGDITLSPSNNAPPTNNAMRTCYLSLYLSDPQDEKQVGLWMQQIPFVTMHRTQNAATDPFVRDGLQMVGQKISWEKCQITFPVAFANTANISFLFTVYFREK